MLDLGLTDGAYPTDWPKISNALVASAASQASRLLAAAEPSENSRSLLIINWDRLQTTLQAYRIGSEVGTSAWTI